MFGHNLYCNSAKTKHTHTHTDTHTHACTHAHTHARTHACHSLLGGEGAPTSHSLLGGVGGAGPLGTGLIQTYFLVTCLCAEAYLECVGQQLRSSKHGNVLA